MTPPLATPATTPGRATPPTDAAIPSEDAGRSRPSGKLTGRGDRRLGSPRNAKRHATSALNQENPAVGAETRRRTEIKRNAAWSPCHGRGPVARRARLGHSTAAQTLGPDGQELLRRAGSRRIRPGLESRATRDLLRRGRPDGGRVPAPQRGTFDAYADYQGTLLTYLGGRPTSTAPRRTPRRQAARHRPRRDHAAPAVDVNGFFVTRRTARKST